MKYFNDNEIDMDLKTTNKLTEFSSISILKRDVFSEIHLGFFVNTPEIQIIRRIATASPWWSRPLAWCLLKREIHTLKKLKDVKGVPQLIAVDQQGLYRSWIEGTPLHLARPATPGFYRSAHKILQNLRRLGITHNDLAKPQNWLMTPEGNATFIDFQLASVHKDRGALYCYFAYEDFRHLIKQKNSFAPNLMTPTEQRILKQRSWPSNLWLATSKKIYNFFTRTVFNWSDGEGTGDRLQNQGPKIRKLLIKNNNIHDIAITLYSLPAKGVGLYMFVETNNLDEKAIRILLCGYKVELIQPVQILPRYADGNIRKDILQLIAMNQMIELDNLLIREPELADIIKPIVADRLNFTDRRLNEIEKNQ
ncbi:MAG: Serine/threonine protein kinase [Candidatus Tokpelaia sp. JSC188]|nr:MAG: Serine/threonine protein kinase [Candidatus Tokpelaia sp. JSC188]